MMRPSFEGTSAVSFTSWVLIDILMTRVKGMTTLTPGERTSEETLPKRSFTPTWPAGIMVIGLPIRRTIRAIAITASRTTRRPDGNGGTISKVLAMGSSLIRGGSYQLHHLQEMPHLVLLRFQVLARPVGRVHLERHALHDLQAVTADRDVLGRVVRHEPHLADSEVAQDLRADPVVPDVRRESQLLVGRDGVVTLVLELVRFQLVHEPDAAPLLEEVEEDAPPGFDDLLHRERELRPAVAAARTEDVPRQTLGVHANEHGLFLPNLAVHERDVLLVSDVAPVGVEAELAESGRKVRRGDSLDEPLRLHPVADEVGDGDHHQAVLPAELRELGHARHRAVLVHDFAEDGGRVEAGDPREVDRRLRLPRSLQDAA